MNPDIEARKKIDRGIGMLLVKSNKYRNSPSIFGYIALQLPHRPTDEIDTAAVKLLGNGHIELIYYPKFINSLTNAQIRYVIIHEMTHVINDHLTRMEGRNPLLFNVAADWAVNHDIEEYYANTFIERPGDDILLPPEEAMEFVNNKAVSELFYEYLRQNVKQAKPNAWSEDHQFSDADKLPSVVPTAGKAYSRSLVNSAARMAGDDLPNYLKERLSKLNEHKVSWNRYLRAFANSFVVVDSKNSWTRNNRRFPPIENEDGEVVPMFPGYIPVRSSKLGIIVDTSGSISQKELAQFFGEIKAISGLAESTVIQIDTRIRDITPLPLNKFSHGDIQIDIKGGGGTDLNPALKYCAEHRDIDGIVIFTDGWLASNAINTKKRELWTLCSNGKKVIPGVNLKTRNATIIRIEE